MLRRKFVIRIALICGNSRCVVKCCSVNRKDNREKFVESSAREFSRPVEVLTYV